MAKIKTLFVNGDQLDVVPANLSAESLTLNNGNNTFAALSCDSNGHGRLVLDGISFDAAALSATYTANTLLEGLV